MSSALEYYDPAKDSRAATQNELWMLFKKGEAWVAENVLAGNGLAYTGTSPSRPSKYMGLVMPEGDTLGDLLVVSDGPPTEEIRLAGLEDDLIPALPQAQTVLGLRKALVARHRTTYLLSDEKGNLADAGPMMPDFYFHSVYPAKDGIAQRVYLVEPERGEPERAKGARYDMPETLALGQPAGPDDYIRQKENGMPPPIMVTEYQVMMDVIDALRSLRPGGGMRPQ